MAADQSSGRRSPPPPSVDNAAAAAGVWKMPSSASSVAGPVIADVESWPALSEATKNQPKSTVDHLPVATSQAARNQSKAVHPPTSQAHSTPHLKKNSNTNHKTRDNQASSHSRHRKRGGGSSGGPSQNGIHPHARPQPLARPTPPPPLEGVRTSPPPPPPPPLPPLPPYPIYEGPFGPLPPPMQFFFQPPFNSNNWERGPVRGFLPQPPPMSDQHFRRGFIPRGNFMGRPHGDGAGNNGHVIGRDHRDSRNTSHNGFVRPSRAQGAIPPPPPLPHFTMRPIRPFPDHVGLDMALPYASYLPPSPEFLMRFAPPVPPPLPPLAPSPMVPDLHFELMKQIDHYFSDNNLARDEYLRSHMDEEGWVNIDFIAKFPKVQEKTQNLQIILESLRGSSVVEVQENRIRRRENWRKWIIAVAPPSSSGSSSKGQAESGVIEISRD